MSKRTQEVLLRTSERASYKKCLGAWARAFVDGIKPTTSAPALRFGSLVHAAMEARYPPGVKRGPHPAKTFEKLYAEELKEQEGFGFRDEDGEWHNALEMGVAMMNGYVNKYGKDEEWKVIASEQAFQVKMCDEAGRYRVTYVGIFDGIWKNRASGQLILKDYKTAKSISTAHLALDEQAGSYWAFAPEWLKEQGVLAEDAVLAGLLYTFMRKGLPDARPRNMAGHYLNKPKKDALLEEWRRTNGTKKPPGTVDDLIASMGDRALLLGEVSSNQPPPLFHREMVYRDEADAANLRTRVMQEAREHRLVREGKLDIYKNPSPGPFGCPGCGYRNICELHETGADWEMMRDATMTEWDGYAEHELYNRN